jgi:hypothetical protein
VLAEAILRELGAKVTHHPIACYLGDHAGGSDAQADTVALNDRRLRKWERNDGQSINQNVFRRFIQCCGCQSHGPMAGAQNVDAIDFDGINNAERPPDLGIGHQIRINILPQFGGKLLGIVQATMAKFFRKNYSSSDNWTCQRTAPRFVKPSNTRYTGGAQFFLVTKSASPVHAAYYAEILMVRSGM